MSESQYWPSLREIKAQNEELKKELQELKELVQKLVDELL